jgi:hypothetical protein
MLYAEKNQLLNLKFGEAEDWDRYDENNGIRISQWTPEDAKQRFLDRFEELYNRRIN